jgi:hypothetical protein
MVLLPADQGLRLDASNCSARRSTAVNLYGQALGVDTLETARDGANEVRRRGARHTVAAPDTRSQRRVRDGTVTFRRCCVCASHLQVAAVGVLGAEEGERLAAHRVHSVVDQ